MTESETMILTTQNCYRSCGYRQIISTCFH